MAWAMWRGRIRKHSTSEAISTAITVNGMSAISVPKRPPITTSDQKAITVVSVAENTGANMRRAAFSAATAGGSPRTRARWSACSPTTMASSTTMPSVMMSAKSEIMLIVSPAAHISAMAASSATGMPAATQNAVRALRKRNRSPTTSRSPVAALSSRMPMRPVMCSARVRMRSIRTPSGSPASTAAAARSTRSWISMASPAAERSTRMETAGSSPTK